MRISLLVGLLGIGLLLIGVLGCSSNDTFDLSGTAQSQVTGTLLPNVNVQLLDSSGSQVGSTVATDIAGAFSFLNRSEATYGFETIKPGLVRSFFAPFRLRNGNLNGIVLNQLSQAQLEVIAPTATVPTDGTATVVAFGTNALGDSVPVTVAVGGFGPSPIGDPSVLTGITRGTYTIRVVEGLVAGNPTQTFKQVRLLGDTVTIVRASFSD